MFRAPSVPRGRAPGRAAVAAAVALAAPLALVAALGPSASAEGQAEGQANGQAEAGLYTDPFSTTFAAAANLTGQARDDAQRLGAVPTSTWLTSGSPAEVSAQAADVVSRANAEGDVATLVAYNVPFRDCAQYSAGGATSQAEYRAWIDGVADGVGDGEAVVVVEPDGLGVIPWYTTLEGTQEWCKPAEADAATAAAERFEMINYAVDTLGGLPGTKVYLDVGHNGWLNVGDATDRLIKAGVADADGFALNTSNYQYTANLTAYGRWVSSCIAYVTEVAPGDFGSCGNQYWNGGPANDWTGVAMSPYAEWSSGNPDPALDTAGVDSRYEQQLGDVEPSTHYVLDTSRNGRGPWEAPAGKYSDAETWCNPPGRGLGDLPTHETGEELVDAHLWIKVPGESDGKCYRGTGGPLDPERGTEDPAAGRWFTEQARELIELAAEPLPTPECAVDYRVTGRTATGFTGKLRLSVTGDETVSGWRLRFDLPAGTTVGRGTGAHFDQDGTIVTATHLRHNARLVPGGDPVPVSFKARGAAFEPGYVTLNGKPCLVS
ncbi:glycoside hydrolase family 6 protein [Myceligenerans crystallogenes]|uniref:Glucanase n=1 Tax=Myceligenerans crystallogenes TaxID=316335 RepID=A0ABN2N6D4_9MICO